MSARILLIEDNPANLELMRYVLSAFGHAVSTAIDGEEGFSSVLRERPDLVICDLQLPRADGFEVARRMKTHPALQLIPLVAVTAFAMVGDRERILAAGFDGYIPKPIEPQSFISQIDAFLSRSQHAGVPNVHADAKPKPSEPARPPVEASGKRILIVDDVAANADLMRLTLGMAGHEVEVARNLTQARSQAEASPPDLIISDFHILRERGSDFVAWIRANPRLAKTPFILISSTVLADSDRHMGLARGADKFILRPINPGPFLEQVAECLRFHGAS